MDADRQDVQQVERLTAHIRLTRNPRRRIVEFVEFFEHQNIALAPMDWNRDAEDGHDELGQHFDKNHLKSGSRQWVMLSTKSF